MAKRYHQSKADRMHESSARKSTSMGMRERMHEHMGMTERMHERHHLDRMMREKEMYNADNRYAGADSRKYREMRDASMIHEDHNAVANLPQNVIYRPYGDSSGYLPQDINDTISGIDWQKGYDMHQAKKHFVPKKV